MPKLTLSLGLVALAAIVTILWIVSRHERSGAISPPASEQGGAWSKLRRQVGDETPPPVVIPKARPHAMPADLQTHVRAELGASAADLSLDDTRYARTDAGGVWVFNDRGIVCIVEGTRRALACRTVEEFRGHGLPLGAFDPPAHPSGRPTDFVVLGIVPGWVGKVHLAIGRRKRLLDVGGGVYGVHADVPIIVQRLCAPRGHPCRRP
jgi:hypothetical protein